MINKKCLISFTCIIIASLFLFTACKDEALIYQNQFLNNFGINFIYSKHKKIEADKLKDYISIELNEQEKSDIKKFIYNSKLFYSISEKSSDYIILNEILEENFSEDIINVENGYFSIYNKISQQIIDLSSSDLQNIDMDYFSAIIYDFENGIIYLFNYSVS